MTERSRRMPKLAHSRRLSIGGNAIRLAATLSMALSSTSLVHAAPSPDRTVLPIAPQPFAGQIGRSVQDSTPIQPAPVQAPEGAPNILLVLTDDVGFGAASAFGGPIPTPNLERLVKMGVVYNRFHTAAMCSPTRAALLTGREPHSVSSGSIGELSMGFPGYTGDIPPSAATIGKVLRDNGYNTAWFGKEHNVPHPQASPAGPFDLWPSAKGFDYFYGFIGGAINQFDPLLFRNGAPVDLSHKPKDYILDRDLADNAIGWIHTQKAAAPDKPFFIYYAPGTAHSPHQAPADWIARFRGKFDQGWDAVRKETFEREKSLGIVPANATLTPRPQQIPAWDSLSADQKKVDARLMEVYAAILAFQDNQFGRILDEIERMGLTDNTMILFIEGDNGGTAEGGPDGQLNEGGDMANGVHPSLAEKLARIDEFGGPNTMENYPSGWGWAMNSPFQWTKQVASHLGGTRNPLVVAWPGHVPSGGQVRTQYGYVSDIYPTLLEAAGLPAPRVVDGVPQLPVEGISLAYSFADAKAKDRRTEQVFEMFGNRAVYKDGWLANTTPKRAPWYYGPMTGSPLDYKWELYYLPDDFSQAHDIAAEHPEKLAQLRKRWDELAWQDHIYPISDDFSHRDYASAKTHKSVRNDYVYWGPGISIPQDFGPPLFGRSFQLTADVADGDARAEGVIAATGSRFGGWSFYISNGRPVVYEAYSEIAQNQFRIAGEPLPAGDNKILFDFQYDGGGFNHGGLMRIFVNGKLSGEGRIERTINLPAGFGEAFDTGRDTGVPVSPDYQHEGLFQGQLKRLEFKLGPVDSEKK